MLSVNARASLPPAIGSRVRILTAGYAAGVLGTVESHVELDEQSRDAKGRVVGRMCRVELDAPIPTRWPDHPITDVSFLYQWEVEEVCDEVLP